ncbi:MAG: hypothetical protein IJO10_07760 [Clostridia bacterium]|nr:hypothetical protein [Clostridia bacterium]
MKKALAVLCCALMCLSLVSCGSSSSGAPANKPEATPAPEQESIYFDQLGDITPEAVEVVYNQVDMISHMGGWAHLRIFVEVKNVSDEAIYVGSLNSYTLTKTDGTVLDEGYFNWVSDHEVEPGETFYLYDYTTTEDLQQEEQAVCVPEVDDAMRLGEDPLHVFHQVSDVQVADSDDGDLLYLSGTLHCGDLAEGIADVTMTCVGYDKSGKPVCFFTEIIDKPAANSDVEFTMMAEVYGSVAAKDLSNDLQVCAYSNIPMS